MPLDIIQCVSVSLDQFIRKRITDTYVNVHKDIDANVNIRIHMHPFQTFDIRPVEDCEAVHNTEPAEYSVEGQASHVDERYL